MTKELHLIPMTEFSNDPASFLEEVIRESKPLVIENDRGERAVIKPLPRRKINSRVKTEADRQAFLASFGRWKDVDVDQFLKNNYESRDRSTRPSVEL